MVDEENEHVDVVHEHGSNEDSNVGLTNGRYHTFDMHMKVTGVGVVVQATFSVNMPKYTVREFICLIQGVVVLANRFMSLKKSSIVLPSIASHLMFHL